MLSRDKRLPRATWNTSGLQENVFGNPFSTFDSHRDHHQGSHPCATAKGTRDQFLKLQGRRLFSQEMTNKTEAQFQCRHLQESGQLRVPQHWWSFSRFLWLNSKDSKFRSCNSKNSLVHKHSQFGRYDSKIKRLPVLIFQRKQCYYLRENDYRCTSVTNSQAFSVFLKKIQKYILQNLSIPKT